MEDHAASFNRRRPVILAACMLLCLCSGLSLAWSVFQTPFMEAFGWNNRATSLTYTLQIVFSTLMPLFVGGLQNKIKLKYYLLIGILLHCTGLLMMGFTKSLGWLYLSYGVINGLGVGMIYTCMMAYGVRLYPEHRGLAASLMTGAYGAGSILWAPLSAFLGRYIQFPHIFWVFSAGFFVLMVSVVWQVRELPQSLASPREGPEQAGVFGDNLHWKQMLRTPHFYLLLFSLVAGLSAGLMVVSHASPMMQHSAGLTPATAALLLGVCSAVNTGSRFVVGPLSDSLGRFRVLFALLVVQTLTMLLMAKGAGNFFIVLVLLTGACYGGFSCLLSPLVADIFGPRYLHLNYSFFYASFGIASLIGPQTAAFFMDTTGSYGPAYFIMAGLVALAALVILLGFALPAAGRAKGCSVQ